MVFRCQVCCQVVPSGVPAQRVVVRTRAKKYPYRPEVNRVVRLDRRGKPKVIFVDDPGGVGREIAQELVVCPACASGRNGDPGA
jgi:hypothetical protein